MLTALSNIKNQVILLSIYSKIKLTEETGEMGREKNRHSYIPFSLYSSSSPPSSSSSSCCCCSSYLSFCSSFYSSSSFPSCPSTAAPSLPVRPTRRSAPLLLLLLPPPPPPSAPLAATPSPSPRSYSSFCCSCSCCCYSSFSFPLLLLLLLLLLFLLLLVLPKICSFVNWWTSVNEGRFNINYIKNFALFGVCSSTVNNIILNFPLISLSRKFCNSISSEIRYWFNLKYWVIWLMGTLSS